MICKGLFSYAYGNPLHLKDGELLPKVKCSEIDGGKFVLTVYTANGCQATPSVCSQTRAGKTSESSDY